MSPRRKLLLGTVVLAIIGAAAWSEIRRAERGVEVRAETVGTWSVTSTITATGQVRARRQVNISSDVMGRVTQLTVAEGDEVQAGQVLLTVDPSQLRAAVSRARATVSPAAAPGAPQRAPLLCSERELERLRGIAERDPDLVSRQTLDEAETAVEVQRALVQSAIYGAEQAGAGLQEAEDQLSRTTIRAPISGRVIRLNIEEGETAVIGTMNNPGSLLLTIGDLSVVEAVMAVDETDVPQIAIGDSAVVELDAFPSKLFGARVTSIGNSAIRGNEGTPPPPQGTGGVDFEVILTLMDPPPELRPDLSATADIIVDERHDAVAVPIIAVTVRSREDESSPIRAEEEDQPLGPLARAREADPMEGVFVIREDRAVWTPVTLGITGQERFEVLSGVSVGDRIVSGPYQTIQSLEDGDEVRITQQDDAFR
jgi:HlyD family secretion protein